MRIIATSLLIFLLCLGCTAQASLWVEIEGIPDSMKIGDPLNLKLSVQVPDEGQLLMPDLPKVLNPFELLASPKAPVIDDSQSDSILVFDILATCYKTGDRVFPPIPFKWISGDGSETDSISTEPNIVFIRGIVPEPMLAIVDTTQQPHHLLQPNRQKDAAYNLSEFIPWFLLLLGTAGLFFLVRWLINRKKKGQEETDVGPPPRPPHEIALEELDALRDRKLFQSGDIKLYYTDLSGIIRRYIEAGLGVPAMESTSFQLLRDIESHLHIRNLYSILEYLLSDADLAKFAKHRPDAETCQRDLENAYIFVNKTKPTPQPILSEEAA